ncbi:MAG TPA: hypothetical protein IGS37_01670 [Synechococcales cyanobacterium M55_K2018_004]|nr:hypothetical protein [Synechococcales cyanobacterium M55_K2018_004]
MVKGILITVAVLVFSAVIIGLIGQAREASKAKQMTTALTQYVTQRVGGIVDFEAFSELPPPVARYFRYVLTNGQKFIRVAKIHQSGVLRTSTRTENWLPFTATQLVVPPAVGFVWNAKVKTPLGTHIRVLDSYTAGVGASRVSLSSTFAMASTTGVPELNSGALHRYLAEAVWFPTALLPQCGVVWHPIDDRSALATLTDRGTTVCLTFQFSEVGTVEGVYSNGRFGNFDGEYKQVPWQGCFRDYQVQAGMRVPSYGEVGWYDNGTLQLVWKGHIMNAQYELEA